MLLLLVLAVLIPFSTSQCFTAKDEVRKVSDKAHTSLLQSEFEFSADLLRVVGAQQQNSNVFFSPSSVFKALLLAYFFSANQTETSLKKALHLADDEDKLDIMGAYNLENYYQKLRSIKEQGYQLSSANRLFYAKDLRLQHCIRVLFQEEVFPANFQDNFEGVLKKINNWVAGQTRNVIKDFLTEDSISKETQLVLVNAAYFKGTWKKEFEVDKTFQGKFYLNNGSETVIPFMAQQNEFKCRVDKKIGAEVLELPYTGEDISMFIIMPLKPSPSAVLELLKRLDAPNLHELIKSMASTDPYTLSVTMPKFTVEQSMDLPDILGSLGVGDLFKSTADLSTLTGSKGLYFSDALHKAKIKVNEKGTEAAAATGFFASRMGFDSFNANRPFIYMLYNKASDVPLFFGIYNTPP